MIEFERGKRYGNCSSCRRSELDFAQMALILYHMSLDMDFSDYVEQADEEMRAIEMELESLANEEHYNLIDCLEIICNRRA